MSKKRFSEGLNDLFSDSHTGYGSLFGNDAAATTASTQPSAIERKSVHKSFMTDLDALLQEALDESLERFEANQPDSMTASAKTKSGAAAPLRAPMHSGLDALIRQTVDIQDFSTDENTGKKRLTVALDRTKLEKLKTIARLENAFLKDLLITVIDGYIDEYTQHKGLAL